MAVVTAFPDIADLSMPSAPVIMLTCAGDTGLFHSLPAADAKISRYLAQTPS